MALPIGCAVSVSAGVCTPVVSLAFTCVAANAPLYRCTASDEIAA